MSSLEALQPNASVRGILPDCLVTVVSVQWFLLADDPGAGKTIMAGLLIKELIIRGDLQRCLVVCPGSLAEQWQDELYRRFQLPFDILTNDKLEAARTGNWFLEHNLIIAHLDKLSHNEDVQQKLQAPGLPLGPGSLR
jgi:superfamily II DNA or RNA helicase